MIFAFFFLFWLALGAFDLRLLAYLPTFFHFLMLGLGAALAIAFYWTREQSPRQEEFP